MLRETLKYQSVRDPLTGLFNRRHMEEVLARELLRARNAKPVTVLMVDVDHFKRFNDTFGHEAGDILLRELGSIFISMTRGGDIACRYGGEEFLVILADASLETGCERAGKLEGAGRKPADPSPWRNPPPDYSVGWGRRISGAWHVRHADSQVSRRSAVSGESRGTRPSGRCRRSKRGTRRVPALACRRARLLQHVRQLFPFHQEWF